MVEPVTALSITAQQEPHRWLGLPTIYYREGDLAASTSIWDLFDPAEVEFDHDGLSAYLRFGYAVFGRTPIRGVRFLQANERIETWADGARRVVRDPDPAEAWVGRTGRPERVLEMVRECVRSWEAGCEGPIVLPLSGGYDSRFLLSFIKEPARLRTFTYGLSDDQDRSFEVRYAADLAGRVGAPWRRIPLGFFNHMLDDWHALQGPSTHAHGMYQMEFFRQVRRLVGAGRPLLSGLIGDAWAKMALPDVNAVEDVVRLGYSHGLNADADALHEPPSWKVEAKYFEAAKTWLREPGARVIEAMRLKLILLSYLLRVPEKYDFKPFAPFLDLPIAMEMLTISDDLRNDRVWQQEYFRAKGLMVDDQPPTSDGRNTLNAQGCWLAPPPPLDERLMSALFRPAYVRWVNDRVAAYADWRRLTFFAKWLRVRGAGRAQMLLGITDDRLKAYSAYLTLYPINALLQARELAQDAR